MSDIINLLPENVANQIAAGEVIQRPASLVKELLDNAVDAKSTQISLYVKEAGKALIQVTDNGCGMTANDARLCWERHATSKIKKTEDIFKIHTMGFRGEALASVASVARVEMKTRTADSATGTFVVIEGSKFVTVEETAAPIGTSISVKNLFYNIPARRNFLKSNPVEFKHIHEEFVRCALANPEIALSLIHNDEVLFQLLPNELNARICELFFDKKENQLLNVQEKTTVLNVAGYVGEPTTSKKTRGEQYIFVNRRYVKDPYLNHAITSAFEGLIPKDHFPFYVLQLEVDPSLIDVNIHPSKTEIKFEDERNIYQIVRAVVKKSLSGFLNLAEQHQDFDDNQFLQFNLNRTTTALADQAEFTVGKPTGSNGSFDDLKVSYTQARSQKSQSWEPLFNEGRRTTSDQNDNQTVETAPTPSVVSEQTRFFFQLHQEFIITQVKSGLLLINQQAAHERVLFERYLAALEKTPVASQQFLFPKAVTLNDADEQLLIEILDDIRKLGFNINTFGKNTFVLNGLPPEMHAGEGQDLLMEILESYKNSQYSGQKRGVRIAKILAQKAAIRKGQKLQYEEMNRLADELFACAEPSLSVDGKPCIKMLSLDEIRQFL